MNFASLANVRPPIARSPIITLRTLARLTRVAHVCQCAAINPCTKKKTHVNRPGSCDGRGHLSGLLQVLLPLHASLLLRAESLPSHAHRRPLTRTSAASRMRFFLHLGYLRRSNSRAASGRRAPSILRRPLPRTRHPSLQV